eukprot:Tamp_16046.p1 GENE.Tamp_16046~~Tamp_16046.p1  ORF type:complete len:448 (-),score=69.59 Tamp_16046:63-1406(-)
MRVTVHSGCERAPSAPPMAPCCSQEQYACFFHRGAGVHGTAAAQQDEVSANARGSSRGRRTKTAGVRDNLLLLLCTAFLLQAASVPPPKNVGMHVMQPRLALRGGGVPPGVQELFDMGFDKNEYTRPTFYNERGERIAPPASAFAPGPDKENWAAEEMEAMVHSMDPKDWPKGHPGYNGYPFAGVKRPGFFLEEFIHEESSDPSVQALNRQLWTACAAGEADLANDLLHQGAEVNAGDPREGDMWTAIFYCCTPPFAAGLPDALCNDTALVCENKRIQLLDCLLAHGALVQARDIWGDTPLHYAAVRGYPRLTARLIEVGVDLHSENMYGCTAQRNAEMNHKNVPTCWDAAQVIARAGGYDAGNPDQDPCESTDEKVPTFPRWPEDEFVRLGGIPPLDQLQLDPSEPDYGKMRPEVKRYFRAHALAKQRLRKSMERDLILNADEKQL